MSTLTNEDKISIINQHKRNVEYSKYNLEISVLAENAVSDPDENAITGFNAKIADLDSKLAALDAEIESLS